MAKEKQNTNATRIISGLLGFPLIAGIIIFGNNVIMDILIVAISLISTYEYAHCFKYTKKAKPSMWYIVLVSCMLFFTHFLNDQALKEIMIAIIPVSFLILMIELIISKNKKNIMDIAVTLLGICYIPMMLVFLSIIKTRITEGGILIWYVFFSAWVSDIFAYCIGRRFGKHKFTEISPNKSVEGSVAGIVGAIAVSIVYTIIMNTVTGLGINIALVGIIVLILSVVGQIGDLAASSIKRYCGLKDFGELIPGHGGMLDRIDSVIFILPFAYILLGLLI